MTESVTVDNESKTNIQAIIKKDNNESTNTDTNNNNNYDIEDITDLTLSDNSNSQHTTTNNPTQSTPSNSNSNRSTHSALNIESKSNTELSLDADSPSTDEPAPPSNDDDINNQIINEIINDNDSDNSQEHNPPHGHVHHQVSRAYRKLLVHESQRLKAENGRLLRKVEKMRCIRSSMQNIFDQLQDNDQQLHTISDIKDNDLKEEEEEEDLEIEHLNDLNPTARPNDNTHSQFRLKQKQREDRKKLRQQRLLRFAKSRLHQQQLHYNNSLQIQNANLHSNSHTNLHLSSFMPRICSRPACNHPLRGTGGRSKICCRGCLKNTHTPNCTQRALKMIQRRNIHETVAIDNDDMLPTPQLIRNNAQSQHIFHPKYKNRAPSAFSVVHNNSHSHTRSRSHSHSQSGHSGALNHAMRHRRNGSESSIKYLFCDKCRGKFNSVTELERHKSIHHSPVVAARMHSVSPPRLPPPIPELTSSFHTTMPNQTKNKFRYKKSNITLPTPPVEHSEETENYNPFSSRMGLLGRRRKTSENNHNGNRKRKNSLSQLFSTFMSNSHSRRNNNEEKDDEKQVVNDNDAQSHSHSHRRSLSSILTKRNDSVDIQLSDDDRIILNHDTHRRRLNELRRKLEQRKQRKNESKSNENDEDGDIDLPPVPDIDEKESTVDTGDIVMNRSRSFTAHSNISDRPRPRHRRSNAISNGLSVGIMPFITSSDNDGNDHDEEEKSMQPIPRQHGSHDLDVLALRRKARERKLRRNINGTLPVPAQRPPPLLRNGGNNPFVQHRSFRTHSHSNISSVRTHSSQSHRRHSHSHSHSHRQHTARPVRPHSSNSNNFTYRSNIVINTNNRHRRRTNAEIAMDMERRRRNLVLTNRRRRRPRPRTATLHTNIESDEDDNENDNDNNSISSLQVNINTNRDEEIARLLQQRDSLLQHFHDTIRHTHTHSHTHSHSQSHSSFDINALRQRHSNNGPLHRRSRSASGIKKVDLLCLPLRCVQESDIGKSGSSSNCSICQEKFKVGDQVKTLPCFHFFHVHEIDRWLTNSRACPVCRHSIDEINFK